MSEAKPLVGPLERAIALSLQTPEEHDGVIRKDREDNVVNAIRVMLFFEGGIYVETKVKSIFKMTRDPVIGEEILIEDLVGRFYDVQSGGTGVTFWCGKISCKHDSVSAPKPVSAPSNSAA